MTTTSIQALCLACGRESTAGVIYCDECARVNEAVNPSHYQKGKVECIDAVETATSDLAGVEAFCTGNAIKYLWRWKMKNGVEDLEKAKWYIDRIINLKKDVDE